MLSRNSWAVAQGETLLHTFNRPQNPEAWKLLWRMPLGQTFALEGAIYAFRN